MSRKPQLRRMASEGTARAFAVLAVITVIIAAAGSWFAVRAMQGELRSRASVVQLCQSDNQARARQVTLWTHLIAVSAPPPHQTAAQAAARAKLIASYLAYVRQVFRQRDCHHLHGG